jgi:hypothetical protein
MGIGEVVQRLQVKLINSSFDEVRNLPVPADLTREPALEPNPLSVNVEVSFKLCAITLNAGL